MTKKQIADLLTGAGLIGAALSTYAAGPRWLTTAGFVLAGLAKLGRSFLGPTTVDTTGTT